MKGRLRVAVIYGGRSVEHDVSVITGLQTMQALDRSRYEVYPVFITREGRWIYDLGLYTGDRAVDLRFHYQLQVSPPRRSNAVLLADPSEAGSFLRLTDLFRRRFPQVDVVIPATHGSFGEDGSLQGLLELAGIAYVGSGVLSSALSMDKLMAKVVAGSFGLSVLPHEQITRRDWEASRSGIVESLNERLGYPVVVKPRRLGSSIGVTLAADSAELVVAVDVALEFDKECLIEPALKDATDINCAVLRREELLVSECERPTGRSSVLQFEDKYLERAGQGMNTESEIPASITPEMRDQIRADAAAAFQALQCGGTARVDFLVSGTDAYFNEINTIPGSYAVRLWEASGVNRSDLFSELIDLALAARAETRRTNFAFKSDLLRLAVSSKLGQK